MLTLPLWLLPGGTWPRREVMRLHVTRCAVVTVMALLFFYGLALTPMAEAIALSFIAPLIALYLAAVLLGERIGRRAIAASLLGLAGVVVIAFARIDAPAAAPGAVLGIVAILVSAVLYAWNLILQRQQAQVAGPREIAFFQNALVGLFLAPAAPWFFHLPGGIVLATTLAAAVLAILSLLLMSWAYARAEAQALLPIEYTAFVWAALMGWLWFGEAVTVATLAGVALIVCGCWIAARPGAGQAP
jgi:S-adenosylmethionine uptake transporter